MVVNSTNGSSFIVNECKWLFPCTYNSINSMVGMYNTGLTSCLGINHSNPLFNLDLYGNFQASTDIVAQKKKKEKEITGSNLVMSGRLIQRNFVGSICSSSLTAELEIVDSAGRISWSSIKNKPDVSSSSSASSLLGLGAGLGALFLSATTLGLVYRNALSIDSVADVLRINPIDPSRIQIGFAREQGFSEWIRNRTTSGNASRIFTNIAKNPLAI
jgi:hypothetical protein